MGTQTVTVSNGTAQQTEGLSDHDKAMAEKGAQVAIQSDGQVINQPEANPAESQEENQTVERPEWCPEKFWDAEKGEVNQEALAKSYAELEKGRTSEEETPAEPEGDSKDESEENQQETEQAPLGDAVSKASAEFAEKGELTEDTFKALEKAGLPREYVEAYVDGMKARADLALQATYDVVGGEESYKSMIEWASANLPKEDIEAYNQAIMNTSTAQLAVRGLYAQYTAANGSEGNLIRGNASAPVNDVYKSKSEMVTDMQSPKYKTDPAFRKEVAEKIRRSQQAGINIFQ